ncbi:unnamed protein product [Sphagnum balticum]
MVAVSGLTRRAVSLKIMQPRFSIAPNANSGMAIRSSLSPGYLIPKYFSHFLIALYRGGKSELRETFLSRNMEDTNLDTIGDDSFRDSQIADDEGNDIRRHLYGPLEGDRLLATLKLLLRNLPAVAESHQVFVDNESDTEGGLEGRLVEAGKARRASAGSI